MPRGSEVITNWTLTCGQTLQVFRHIYLQADHNFTNLYNCQWQYITGGGFHGNAKTPSQKKNNSPKYPAYIIKGNVFYKLLYCQHVIVEKHGNLPLFY